MKQQPKKPAGKQPVKGQTVRNRTAARQQARAGAVAPKKTVPTEKKVLISLLALAVLLIICFVTVGAVALRMTGPLFVRYPSPYDNTNLSSYILADPGSYRNQTVKMSAAYADYTDAEWQSYIDSLRYANRKLIAKDQRHTAIGDGDVVSFYILDCTLDGNPAAVGAFAAFNYSNIFTVTVGNNSFGPSFDAAIKGIIPAEKTLRETATSGVLTGNSVIALSYQLFADVRKDGAEEAVWATTAYKTATEARTALSELDEAFRDALLAAYAEKQAVGEEMEFILPAYYDDDKKPETDKVDVKVKATVDFIVTAERSVSLTFTPKASVSSGVRCFYYSGDEAYNNLVSVLYGKEGTYRIVIDTVDDYELPAYDADFVKNTLGFATDKTEEGEVLAAFRAARNEAKKESYENEVLNTLYQQITTAIVNGGLIKSVPEEALREAYTSAQSELAYLYKVYGEDYYNNTNGAVSDIDKFALYYCYNMYGRQDISSASAYYSYYAQEICKQELVMYFIYRNEKLKVTDALLEEAYRDYVDDLIARAGNEEVYNEAFFVETIGKDALYRTARKNYAVKRLVDSYLLANSTVTVE